MKYLLDFFLQRKLLVNLLVIIVFIAGLLTIFTIQKEGIPNISINQMIIATIYPGAAPSDVELNVTMVIEDALEETEGVKSISSVSQEGLSQIVVEIDSNLSDRQAYDVKREIEKTVDRISDLPKDILKRPIISEIKTSMFPIIEINIQGKDELAIRKMVDKLELKIKRSPGVSKISKVGYRVQELRVEVDPTKLRSTETSITELLNIINANNIRLSGGSLETLPKEKSVITVEELKTPDDIKNIIIRSNFSGKNLKVKDVASVVKDYKKQDLYVRSNNENSISICVHKKESADILKTIKGIKKVLNSAKWEEGTSYTLSNDLSTYTRNRLNMVASNGLMGMALVFGLLWLFLDIKTAFWASFCIPFSFMLAFLFFQRIGLTINALSLGGLILVLGMLVDNAIIVADNIHKAREEGKTSRKDIVDAVYDIASPVSLSVFTTIVAFLPLLFLPGIIGKFIWAIPAVVIIVLLASLFESMFMLPSHLSPNENKQQKIIGKKKFMIKMENIYEKLLTKTLKNKYKFLLFIFLLFILSLWYAKNYIPFYFAPTDGATAFSIKLQAPIGTPIERTLAMVRPVEKIVAQLPKSELESFSARIGYDSSIYWTNLGTDSNRAIIYVYLTPKNTRGRTAQEIINKLQKDINPYTKGFTKVITAISTNGPQAGKSISIQLLSNNEEQRKKAGLELISFLQKTKGTTEIETDVEEGKEELRLLMDHEKISMLGLDIFSVASTLRTAFAGTTITSIREGDESIDLIVKLAPEFRKDSNNLLDLPVINREGKLIRIRNFATLIPQNNVPSITRYDRLGSISIQGEAVKGQATPLEIMAKAKKFINSTLAEKYPDVTFEFKGESKATMDSFGDIGKLFIIALIGIYFVLILGFGSFIEPLLIMTAIPLSIIPVILAFGLHGKPLTFQALIGFVGLAGVVVNDSLVMVDQVKKIDCKTNHGYIDCIIEGSVTRLRPIILTTVTTVGGVIPMVYGWGGYDEYLMPMAMSLGYGLLGATILTLFVVPCFIAIIESFKTKKYKKS
jgi:multidrug efflux pump subunit AcrB